MFVITKSVTGKKALIELCGIESSITQEGFGLIKDAWKRNPSVLGLKALNHEHIYLRQGNRISFRQRYQDVKP